MKSDRERITELLYRSFDDELSSVEHEQLKQALRDSSELRGELEQIINMRARLAESAPDSFGPLFAQRVLNRLNSTVTKHNGEAFSELFLQMFRPVAIAGAAAVILLLFINLYTGDSFSLQAALGISESDAYSLWETPLETMLGGS